MIFNHPSSDAHDGVAGPLNGHVVVVSPHFDDAIISLGSTIAQAVQSGARVEVLTVFGDLPSSDAPASAWDRECGFSTEGHAARVRREEDRLACSIVGAEPRWLDFGSECYERRGSEDDIWRVVASAAGSADSVIIPGFPLAHADHACLSNLLVQRRLAIPKLGLYVEQPYEFYLKRSRQCPAVAPTLEPFVHGSIAWARTRTSRTHHRAKLQAVRCYRSQLRHLGLGHLRLHRMLWRESVRGGETIAWLS